MKKKIKIEWIDRGVEPKSPPNPAYPNGVDLDLSKGRPYCEIMLVPYPAPRCGYFLVKCSTCGTDALITTAGRPDDPRSVKIACKLQ